jgi:hypothetical protein
MDLYVYGGTVFVVGFMLGWLWKKIKDDMWPPRDRNPY